MHQTECFCALRNITPALIIRSRVLIIIIFFMLVSNYWLITVFILQASSDGQLQVSIRGPHPRVSMYNDLYIRQMFATQPSRRLDLHVYRFRARELVVA